MRKQVKIVPINYFPTWPHGNDIVTGDLHYLYNIIPPNLQIGPHIHIFKEETYAYFAELARHTRSKTHSLLGRGCPCGGMLVLVAHHCLQNVGH